MINWGSEYFKETKEGNCMHNNLDMAQKGEHEERNWTSFSKSNRNYFYKN